MILDQIRLRGSPASCASLSLRREMPRGGGVISRPQDDLCIFIWTSLMIICIQVEEKHLLATATGCYLLFGICNLMLFTGKYCQRAETSLLFINPNFCLCPFPVFLSSLNRESLSRELFCSLSRDESCNSLKLPPGKVFRDGSHSWLKIALSNNSRRANML